MHRKGKWALYLALFGALALAGCGSDEPPQPKATPIGGKAPIGGKTEGAAEPAVNHPPVIQRIDLSPDKPTPGAIITAEVEFSDPDGDDVSLSYDWAVDGVRAGEDQSTLLLGDFPKGSRIQLTVIARDGDSKSQPETVSTDVANRPPKMLGVVIEPLDEVRANRDIAANPRAQDADDDALEYVYRWRINGELVDVEGPILTADHYRRGDEIQLTVEANDGEESSEPLRSAPFTVANSPPQITSTPGAFDEDGTFRYSVLAEDPDGDRILRYALVTGPEGMEIDVVRGELTWTPTPEQAGSHPVTIEVDDRMGGVSTQSFDVRVEFEEAPSAEPPAVPAASAS